MIAIIDYGLGNVMAFAHVFNKLNIPAAIVKRAEQLAGIDKMILPGVGSFDFAMRRFDESGMRLPIEEMVLQRGVPVLGVCVGMQMLALSSEEGVLPGLGWLDGEVKRFGPSPAGRISRVPHMGWNTIRPVKSGGLLTGMDLQARFYFLHSYYMCPRRRDDVIATTDYGIEFASAVSTKNIFGVQFHPEKSHQWGVRLLENFSRL